MTARQITLDEVTLQGTADKVPYSPWGYVIDKDAKVYALSERWVHGIILALLYPEAAAAAGFEPPMREDGDLDVYRYQDFEHECAHAFAAIRVATSLLTGTTTISTGRKAPSEPQIAALVATLSAIGLKGNNTLTGEDDDITVAEFVDSLRTRLADEREQGKEGSAE